MILDLFGQARGPLATALLDPEMATAQPRRRSGQMGEAQTGAKRFAHAWRASEKAPSTQRRRHGFLRSYSLQYKAADGLDCDASRRDEGFGQQNGAPEFAAKAFDARD